MRVQGLFSASLNKDASKERSGKKMECVIALSSVTYAMKGASLLKMNGIFAQSVRLEADQTKRGCAYGLKILKSERTRASRLLQQNGIPFSEIVNVRS